MDVGEALRELGGVATRSVLVTRCGAVALARARRSGEVVLDARGRYALPGSDGPLRIANRMTGVLSHRSAAQHWGWAQKRVPDRPELVFPRGRKLAPSQRRGIVVRRGQLAPEEVDGLVTSRKRTIADCLRSLPPDEALAIADSALREGDETETGLAVLASSLQGPGRKQALAIAERASGLAANPFESVLRHLALETGLSVRPQVPLWGREFLGRPDLVDLDRHLILEADSFGWHGSRAALHADARRYNGFVVHGWTVLRFSWEDVMHRPEHVLEVLRLIHGRTNRAPGSDDEREDPDDGPLWYVGG